MQIEGGKTKTGRSATGGCIGVEARRLCDFPRLSTIVHLGGVAGEGDENCIFAGTSFPHGAVLLSR